MDWFPVTLSLQVALLATGLDIGMGLGIAWLLARTRIPGRDLLGALFSLPLILPPTVLGYYLLIVLGRRSPIGFWLDQIGFPVVFTWRGAVIAAAVAALPLFVQSARTALEAVDPELENVGRTLGRSDLEVFWTITLPLAWRGIVAGAMLCFARALGDFGATLMVAGNIPGRTQTLPIAIYDAVQSNNLNTANQLVILISFIALALLLLAQHLSRRLVR
ncbi:MAG: molybdate ABC transporter permease subunit [Chloroflexi bacterium]|nr:molybdate ABC transporter permease subunit [Chloroflexota bacterium]